jgi:hypothetical protein
MVSMKITVFWDIAPCSLVEGDWRLRGACCLHHQGLHSLPSWWRQYTPLKRCSTSMRLHGAVSQKAVIFMFYFEKSIFWLCWKILDLCRLTALLLCPWFERIVYDMIDCLVKNCSVANIWQDVFKNSYRPSREVGGGQVDPVCFSLWSYNFLVRHLQHVDSVHGQYG